MIPEGFANLPRHERVALLLAPREEGEALQKVSESTCGMEGSGETSAPLRQKHNTPRRQVRGVSQRAGATAQEDGTS